MSKNFGRIATKHTVQRQVEAHVCLFVLRFGLQNGSTHMESIIK